MTFLWKYRYRSNLQDLLNSVSLWYFTCDNQAEYIGGINCLRTLIWSIHGIYVWGFHALYNCWLIWNSWALDKEEVENSFGFVPWTHPNNVVLSSLVFPGKPTTPYISIKISAFHQHCDCFLQISDKVCRVFNSWFCLNSLKLMCRFVIWYYWHSVCCWTQSHSLTRSSTQQSTAESTAFC